MLPGIHRAVLKTLGKGRTKDYCALKYRGCAHERLVRVATVCLAKTPPNASSKDAVTS